MSKSHCGPYLTTIGPILAAAALNLAACQKSAAVPPVVPDVNITDVLQQDVPQYQESVGTTKGFVTADIHPQVSGYIVKQNYHDGDAVRAGQVLFEIDPREYQAELDQAQGNLAKSQATLRKDQLTLQRYTILFQQNVISRQDFDDQTQTTRAHEAQVKADQAALEQARLNLGWTKVTSPVNGVASIASAQVGALVSTTTLLTTVSQVDPIKVEFPISEQLYLSIADRINQDPINRDQTAPRVQLILSDGTTYKYLGRVYGVNGQVDIQTGTIQCLATFENPYNILRPGLYAKVRANTGTIQDALLVPQNAILQTQGQSQVAVVGSDNKVTMRNIQLGQSFGSFQVVQSGLSAGDRVVTEGLQKVHDGGDVNAHFIATAPPQEKLPTSLAAQASVAASSADRR